MEKIISYIEQHNPGFARRIRGATPDEIDSLEQTAGHPLPPDYRYFLSVMGHDDGQLFGQKGISTDVPSLLSFYRESVATGENSVPEDCIVIAVGCAVIEQVYLEHDGLGRVFEGGEGEKSSLWAKSFRNLLYQNAYMAHRQRWLPHAVMHNSTDQTNLSEDVRAVVRSAGLLELDFSDSVTICAESSSATLAFRQIAGETAWVRVAGMDEAAVNDVSRRLMNISVERRFDAHGSHPFSRFR
ncbi:SMI1/KNR4 family protein [Sorangium sp. So ce204]|uniref:SMI1/KNR4 family protein n=1 Tax=Sorangium sp. So ce204 TaxID=3133288 RepID=UPI003F60B8D2